MGGEVLLFSLTVYLILDNWRFYFIGGRARRAAALGLALKVPYTLYLASSPKSFQNLP